VSSLIDRRAPHRSSWLPLLVQVSSFHLAHLKGVSSSRLIISRTDLKSLSVHSCSSAGLCDTVCYSHQESVSPIPDVRINAAPTRSSRNTTRLACCSTQLSQQAYAHSCLNRLSCIVSAVTLSFRNMVGLGCTLLSAQMPFL
jgi:hypothetical protein